jgi:toxin FitB
MSYLVDSNVLSESSKSRGDPHVLEWMSDHDAQLYVSVISLGEILKGIHLLDSGRRRTQIERWYQRIERWAASRILPVDPSLMEVWAQFYASHQRSGRRLPLMDSLLAATALRYKLTLVTRNTADFPEDVPVLNPWTD